jgi:uncharacterized protein YfaP (DUF2135 family)
VEIDLAWDSSADLDLHVFDPRSEEIYHGNPRAESGGELDQDANSRCGGVDRRAESVRWPAGFAPPGRYSIRINHWSSCGAAATNFVLQIVSGSSRQTFSGTLTGPGTAGGRGAGTTVAEFTR